MNRYLTLLLALLIASPAYAYPELRRQKNLATRIIFPIYNSSTGALISGASGLDCEIDEYSDGADPTGFTDVSDTEAEIGTTGIYQITLSSTETNTDMAVVQCKSSSTNAVTYIVALDFKHGVVLTNSSGALDTDTITATSIATDAIGAAEIATSAIGAAEIAADAITSSEIADDSIDAGAIAASAIGASEIATDAIGAAEIADNAIDAGAIASGALTAAKFGYDGALTSESGTTLGLASGAVDADDQFNTGFALVAYDSGGLIEARSCIVDSVNTGDTVVTREDISALVAVADNYVIQADAGCTSLRPTTAERTLDVATTGEAGLDFSNVNGTLDASEIGADAITAAKIATDAIGAAEIATDAIGSLELADNAIDAGAIASSAITSAKFAVSAIDASAIAPDAIGASEIATDAITSAELASSLTVDIVGSFTGSLSGSVGSVGTGGITSASFGAGAIDATAIATDAIGAAEIAASAIGAAEIATGAIDADSTASDFLAEINGEMVDVVNVDTYGELTSCPTATASMTTMLRYMLMVMRNKLTQTTTTQTLYRDDGATSLCTATIGDAAGTFTRGESN